MLMPGNTTSDRLVAPAPAASGPGLDGSTSAARPPEPDRGAQVPVRTILTVIGLVLATGLALLVVYEVRVHSIPAGIAVLIFFIVYQQLENHLLQPLILSRTVQLNPLTVLVSILVAVELAGILGALLAIPAAGILQVILRDIWDHRRGRPKEEPTVGAEKVPVSTVASKNEPPAR